MSLDVIAERLTSIDATLEVVGAALGAIDPAAVYCGGFDYAVTRIYKTNSPECSALSPPDDRPWQVVCVTASDRAYDAIVIWRAPKEGT